VSKSSSLDIQNSSFTWLVVDISCQLGIQLELSPGALQMTSLCVLGFPQHILGSKKEHPRNKYSKSTREKS
jgi:hypothetical protein